MTNNARAGNALVWQLNRRASVIINSPVNADEVKMRLEYFKITKPATKKAVELTGNEQNMADFIAVFHVHKSDLMASKVPSAKNFKRLNTDEAVWHYEKNGKYCPFSSSHNKQVDDDWKSQKDCSQFMDDNSTYVVKFETMTEMIKPRPNRLKQKQIICKVDRRAPMNTHTKGPRSCSRGVQKDINVKNVYDNAVEPSIAASSATSQPGASSNSDERDGRYGYDDYGNQIAKGKYKRDGAENDQDDAGHHANINNQGLKPSDRRLKNRSPQPSKDVIAMNDVDKVAMNDIEQAPSVPEEDCLGNRSAVKEPIKSLQGKLNFSIKLNDEQKTPPHWSADGVVVTTCSISPSSNEYEHVREKLMNGLPKVNIVQIDRIENQELFVSYAVKKVSVKQRCPADSEFERILWHGLAVKQTLSGQIMPITNINNRGFNRTYCRASSGLAVYGDGVYFAVNPNIAAKYSSPDSNGFQYMYCCRVLTGEFTNGTSGMIEAPYKNVNKTEWYDSVVDYEKSPSIFVIFHDTQAYPEYLITFRLDK